ncbi:MAG: hypothetical protein LBT99_03640 [Bifidobacteriaceae bacterium]|jgi:hypothetical protein|nr:hypothetical protein [Bifidobacteriaceae bacterium]
MKTQKSCNVWFGFKKFCLSLVACMALATGSVFVAPLDANAGISFSNSRYKEIRWYDDTGTTLPRVPNYSKYNLLNIVQPGDVIYEADTFFGLTGHVSTIEGIFYDSTLNRDYIRLVETHNRFMVRGYGVVRGVLDDQRVDDRGITIYRVNNATQAQRQAAAVWPIAQLGKPYTFNFFYYTSSPNNADWYCSELVWASWLNQGINIRNNGWLAISAAITPRDVSSYSQAVTKIFKGDKT